MKVVINEQPQRFYVALDKWTAAVGHGIQIEQFNFAAIPTEESLNVIEETSGVRVLEIAWTEENIAATKTKERTMQFFQEVAQALVKALEEKPHYWEDIAAGEEWNEKRLGAKPPTEDFDLQKYVKERTE